MIDLPSLGTARRTKADTFVVIAWTLLLSLLFLLAVDAFVQTPGRDSGAFLYIAHGILEGETPYLDRWGHKGPLIFVLNAVGLLLSETWGVWLVQLGFLTGTCLTAGKLLESRFGAVAGLFSLTVLLIYFIKFLHGGNFTEQYALMLQFMALALFVGVERKDESLASPKFLAVLGALGGAAFMLRPNLIGVWVAIGFVWLAQRDGALRKLGWTAAGGLATLAVFVVWFALAGGLFAFWDAVIVYNVNYSNVSLAVQFGAVRETLGKFFPLTWVLLLVWSIGLWQVLSGNAASRGELLVRLAVVLLPVEVVLANLSGRGYEHYYLALIPVVCLLSAFAVRLLLDTFQTRHPWIPVGLFVLTGFTCVTSSHLQLHLIPDDVGKYRNLRAYLERGDPVINHVREHTEEEDVILVWGARSWYYVSSGRAAPTRFHFGWPLVKEGYASPELVAEFVADVVANPPVLIIDTHSVSMPPLDATDAERRQRSRVVAPLVDQLRPFFEFVDGQYERVRTVGPVDVYRRIGSARVSQRSRQFLQRFGAAHVQQQLVLGDAANHRRPELPQRRLETPQPRAACERDGDGATLQRLTG